MHNSPRDMHGTQLSATDIQSVGYFKSVQGLGKQIHSHTVWEAVYYLQGAPKCRVDDHVIDTVPGTILLIPPGVPHGEISKEPWACFYLLIKRSMVTEEFLELHDDGDRSVDRICTALAREWRSKQAEREKMLVLLLEQLGIVLRRLHPSTAPSPAEALVRQFERALEERFTEPTTISSLCREVGVSSSYMRAQFMKLRGQTPSQRLQQMRAQHALAAIQSSNQSLETIAEISGYASASHLSRHVKRATGKPPGDFRTTIKESS
jgi:AraC-like DNA-binding protein/quercetin dioxygenase-like cupin family protein